MTKLCRYPKTDPTSPADIKIKRETEAAIVEASNIFWKRMPTD